MTSTSRIPLYLSLLVAEFGLYLLVRRLEAGRDGLRVRAVLLIFCAALAPEFSLYKPMTRSAGHITAGTPAL